LLPTELIGSYALPGWLVAFSERVEERGDLGETEIEEALEDAVRIALLDQERAGVDVVTDGEMGRRDFIQSFYGLLTGLQQLRPARVLGAAGYDQNPRYEVVDRIAAPQGLGIAGEVRRLQQHTRKPFKICVPGPITMSLPLILKAGYRDREALLEDMIQIVNAEMKALVAAGAAYLQIDEPRYATSQADARRLVEVFNRTRDGVGARVGLHICFGNFRGRSRDPRDYSYIISSLGEARCDQFNLEFANREFAQIELLAELPSDRQVGVGVIDVKSYFVETPAEVAERIRLAAEYFPVQQLVVTPDCGFNHCPRHVAFGKMRAMVEGARLVRRELTGA
jgi:5-methyltetrahydropteroyltriglutamate--homocysteine methyltransferase